MIGVAAISRNRVIGKDSKIPWYSREDFAWFRELTWGKNILVGRKTFLTLPYLPNRTVFILSNLLHNSLCIGQNNKLIEIHINEVQPDSISVRNSKGVVISDDLIENLNEDYFLCGGAEVYRTCLDKCKELYLTEFYFDIEESGNTVKFPFNDSQLAKMFNYCESVKSIKDGRIWKYSR